MQSSIPSVRSYFIVFGCLVLLTLLTSGIAVLPIGNLHTPVGLVIAVTKAILVVCFFMHLLHSGRVSWVMLGAALFMLFVMLYLTLADYFTRPAMGKWAALDWAPMAGFFL
jgi:cytochrome c oxidase subunit IV